VKATRPPRELTEQENALRNEVYKSNTAKVELTSQIAQPTTASPRSTASSHCSSASWRSLLDQIGKLKREEDTLPSSGRLEADQASRAAAGRGDDARTRSSPRT
jgi:hypothetical protein